MKKLKVQVLEIFIRIFKNILAIFYKRFKKEFTGSIRESVKEAWEKEKVKKQKPFLNIFFCN